MRCKGKYKATRKTDTKEEPEGYESWRPGNDITSKCDHKRRQGAPYRRNHRGLEAKEEEWRGHRSEKKKDSGRKEREEREDADKHSLTWD